MYSNKPMSESQGSIISADKSDEDLWWKRDESQVRQFIGSGEDVVTDDKPPYQLPVCQC